MGPRLTFLAVLASIVIFLPGSLDAGPKLTFGESQELEILAAVQTWGVLTTDILSDFNGDRRLDPADSRWDLFIRRGRLGFRGRLSRSIGYQVMLAYDNLGKDRLTGVPSTAQSVENDLFELWDTMVTWEAHPQWCVVTAGYFRPQVGRESITSSLRLNSIDKALTNVYLREHVVGRSSGRETGVNVGGLRGEGRWELNYNVGVFDTNYDRIAGSGPEWSPLIVYRGGVTFGDPEMQQYQISYDVNYFGRRKGVTFALNGTRQGRTNESVDTSGNYSGGFDRNSSLGIDVLANYGPLSVNVEYDWLTRGFSASFLAAHPAAVPAAEYTDRVWHVRAGWTTAVGGGRMLEPVIIYTAFYGDRVSAVYPNGEDKALDVGLNLYLDRNNLKLNAHYVAQDGQSKSRFTDDQTFQRGDFFAIGFQYVF